MSKQETRDALLKAGMEVFSTEGLDAPSLDGICERAGFTRGAFYVHFKDCEEFIVAVMERATLRFLDAIVSSGGEQLDLAQVVAAFTEAATTGSFRVFGEVPLHQFLAACARSPALRARYTALVAEAMRRLAAATRAGQRAEALRGDVDPEQLAHVLVAVALGTEVLREIGAPVDAAAYSAMVMKLLVPRG